MLKLLESRHPLETFLGACFQGSACIRSARHLTGGASRETWSLEVDVSDAPETGLKSLVLRGDMGGTIQDEALSREQEFRVLEAVHLAGVKVPRPRWLCLDPAVIGVPFFITDYLAGESVGRRVLKDTSLEAARGRLPQQLGEQLAVIHSIDPIKAGLAFLEPADSGASPARSALAHADRQLERLGEPHPVLEWALRWLQAHAPNCERRLLLHGDFRIGNVMVGPEGLRGVFDWEFAHVGDPAEDLACPCVKSWRFGNDALRLGGLGQLEEMIEAYERAGGTQVDPRAIDYWEILGNFRWAVGCIAQAARHLSGQTQSIELLSLGRRTAEVEQELLNLIEARI
jgi:aminoglycoside phosphotransferase (APT) family kinase protein